MTANASSTYGTVVTLSSTVPNTWASGNSISYSYSVAGEMTS